MEKAACSAPYAPVRREPDEGAEQVTQALFADPFEVEEQADGWVRVKLADGYVGWVRADVVGEPPPKDRAHVVVVPQAADRFLGTWLPAPGLRTEPLAAARRKASGQAVAETALMFLGAPYEWGGVTVNGLDCSGLVQVVHRRFGLLLPRDSKDQEGAGQEVDPAETLPGDLLFYGDHVAIALEDGEIVHARESAAKVIREPHPDDLRARLRAVRRLYDADE